MAFAASDARMPCAMEALEKLQMEAEGLEKRLHGLRDAVTGPRPVGPSPAISDPGPGLNGRLQRIGHSLAAASSVLNDLERELTGGPR